MKNFLQIERDRTNYHLNPLKNTVHRSSLTAPNLPRSETWLSFVNHFFLKRRYKSIALKISAVDKNGIYLDSYTIQVQNPKVYNINLNNLFYNLKTNNFLIEFFSEKNLFIPFPAVMINHVGRDFCNSVHSYNRVLNDIFEDDKINKNYVPEASFDLKINNKYDTFFNLTAGISGIDKEQICINYKKDKLNIKKKIIISLPRLSYRSFSLSNILKKKLSGGIIKILQPKQKMFYGRMLAGRINKKTGSFSANHSYYDSSGTKEYFKSFNSYRTYPYFEGYKNMITMYPVFSPSKLDIKIQVLSNNKMYISNSHKFSSNSSNPLNLIINDFVDSKNLKNVTAFSILAFSKKRKIPTRLNHQLIYGNINETNSLQCSINVSLINENFFIPKKKTGFIWGQVISSKIYDSKLGICLKNPDGKNEKIKIKFYSEDGLVKTIFKNLKIKESLIFDINKLFKNSKKLKFYWYVIESLSADLSSYSFHSNKISGNSSGEHNF